MSLPDPHAIRARLAGRDDLAELHELEADCEQLDAELAEESLENAHRFGDADGGRGVPPPDPDPPRPSWDDPDGWGHFRR